MRATDAELQEEFRTLERLDTEHLIDLIPKCPACKRRLVHRAYGRRFQEDHRFVQCQAGHVWYLTSVFHGDS